MWRKIFRGLLWFLAIDVIVAALLLIVLSPRVMSLFVKPPVEIYHKSTSTEVYKAYQEPNEDGKMVAVIPYFSEGDGDPRHFDHFASLVDEVVRNKDKWVEIVVVITSPGGIVPYYGHGYSQMKRLAELDAKLVVFVDTIGASGGYLMALPADEIRAADWAIVGSVSVVAFVPNLRKAAERVGIEPRVIASGKYKRTLSFWDDNNPEATEHFTEGLNTIHSSFISFVRKHRPQARIELIETGAHWLASDSVAKELKLVDEIGTSAEYLLELNRSRTYVRYTRKIKTTLADFFLGILPGLVESALKHLLLSDGVLPRFGG